MNRPFRFLGRLPAAVILLAPIAGASCGGQEVTFRDLVRRYYETGDGQELAQVTGLAKPAKHVVALDYTILLLRGDQEEPVDPKTQQFKLGDRIRVRIQPLADTYVYIFHEGASGERTCLVPAREEETPFIKANEQLVLPEDGYFEFVAPPGKEQLVVVATERPIADLALLSNIVFKKPGEALTPEEQAVKDSLSATVEKTLQSIRQRQNATISFRGLPNRKERRQFAEQVSAAGATQVRLEEPPHGEAGGTLAIAASSDEAPQLYVSISLESVRTP